MRQHIQWIFNITQCLWSHLPRNIIHTIPVLSALLNKRNIPSQPEGKGCGFNQYETWSEPELSIQMWRLNTRICFKTRLETLHIHDIQGYFHRKGKEYFQRPPIFKHMCIHTLFMSCKEKKHSKINLIIANDYKN